MTDLRLGIIGMSEGNGHPYSWSAIFNGYNATFMKDCGFPVIPIYLAKQNFPADSISDARVTNIWTQSLSLSHHIAQSANIASVNENLTDMIGEVDAILLARDDSENHLKYAAPFINAGIPIYIDKPLATKIKDAEKILSLERYPGQIFSCSALRFSEELTLPLKDHKRLGAINKIIGYTPNSWQKYSVHIIEPILKYIPYNLEIKSFHSAKTNKAHILNLTYSNGLSVQLNCVNEKYQPVKITLHGENKVCELVFEKTFDAFKSSLNNFIDGVTSRKVKITHSDMYRTVNLVELGLNYE